MNTSKDATQPERPICGAKFREMLKCVEHTGTIACTQKINDFLACERLVFRAALTRQPPPAAPADRVRLKERAPKPKPSESDAMPPPGVLLGRVVDKQIVACSSLAESVRRPEFRVGFWSFSKRMVADIRVSCDAVVVKAGKVFNELRNWLSSNGD